MKIKDMGATYYINWFPSLFVVDTYRDIGLKILNSHLKMKDMIRKLSFLINLANVNKQIRR